MMNKQRERMKASEALAMKPDQVDKPQSIPENDPMFKAWDELTTDQKIERMRQHVKSLEGSYNDLYAKMRMLQGHQHGQDGKVLVEISHHTGEGNCATTRGNMF